MFKKILLLIIILSPFLFTFIVGYPIVTTQKQQTRVKQKLALYPSSRCYAVDDLNTYIKCLISNPRLNGAKIIKTVYTETSMMYPGFGNIITITFLLQIILLITILYDHDSFKTRSPPTRG